MSCIFVNRKKGINCFAVLLSSPRKVDDISLIEVPRRDVITQKCVLHSSLFISASVFHVEIESLM